MESSSDVDVAFSTNATYIHPTQKGLFIKKYQYVTVIKNKSRKIHEILDR